MSKIVSGEALPSSNIRRLLRLYHGLNSLAMECSPMPDKAMDHITEAYFVIEREIIDAPTDGEGDVADKFRFLAEMIEDQAGASLMEDAALDAATAALANLRARQEEEHRQLAVQFFSRNHAYFRDAAE